MNERFLPSTASHLRLMAPGQRIRIDLSVPAMRVVLPMALVLCSIDARAGQPLNITPAEMALIPAYCKDANTFGYSGEGAGNESPNAPRWVAAMGKGFWAIHHYCWALINLQRAQGANVSPTEKQYLRGTAVNDFSYVIQNSPPNFILLPEIFTKMGEVQLDLKQPTEANASFARARSMKPDYWPAYFRWARYLQYLGRKADARQLVEEGLSYSPDTKVLQDLLKELGGDPNTLKRESRPKGSASTSTQSVEPAVPSANSKESAIDAK